MSDNTTSNDITSVTLLPGDEIKAADFEAIKEVVYAELDRRGISYTTGTALQGQKALAEQGASIINNLNKINSNLISRDDIKQSSKFISWQGKNPESPGVIYAIGILKEKPLEGTDSGCKNGCMGLCQAKCTGCTTGCTGKCKTTCKNSCTAVCGGCYECTGTCSGCGGSCRGST